MWRELDARHRRLSENGATSVVVSTSPGREPEWSELSALPKNRHGWFSSNVHILVGASYQYLSSLC